MRAIVYILSTVFIPVWGWSQPAIEWSNAYYGAVEGAAYALAATSDGGCVFGDRYWPGIDEVRLVKISEQGDILWDRRFNGHGLYGTRMRSMSPTPDGGFILLGDYWTSTSIHDIHLIKTDSSGFYEWEQTFSDTTLLYASSVAALPGGGFIISCTQETVNTGNTNVKMVKLDSAGSPIWSRLYGGPGTEYGKLSTLGDGGFICVGGTTSSGAGGTDVWLVRLTPDGDTLWTRTYGGSLEEAGNSIVTMPDGGFMICGRTSSSGAGGSDGLLIRTDSLGNQLWMQTYGDSAEDWFNAIALLNDTSLVMVGATASQYSWLRYAYAVGADTSGEEKWSLSFGWPVVGSPHISAIKSVALGVTPGQNGRIFIGGSVAYTYNYGSFSDAGVSGLRITPTSVEIQADVPERHLLHQNYPNPFNPTTTIRFDITQGSFVKLRIFDVTGRELLTPVNEYLGPGSYSTDVGMPAYPSGVYYYQLQTPAFTSIRKMILMK